MMFLLMSIFFFMYRCLSLNTEIKILQLNHYQTSRQIDYLMKRKYFTIDKWIRMIIHVPFALLILVHNNVVDLFILMLIVYIYVGYKFLQSQKHGTNLKITRRIERLYLVLFILYTFLLYLGMQSEYFIIWSLILMSINKEMVFLANIFITPLEKGIQKYYIEQAKKILRNNSQLLKVGIVGSYGKTSTKNILYHLLKENYLCLKSQNSYNNMMGNTITIRKELKRLHDLFICEMGSDHVGEIERLMKFIEPQYVIITSIGNQHLNTFHTQENIIYEKTSPLLFLRKEDTAFLNIDNAYIQENLHKGVCKKITFGENEKADFHIKDIEYHEQGSSFSIVYHGNTTTFHTSLLGYYNIMNIAGGICVAHTLEVPMSILQRLVASITPIEHRLQSIAKGHYTLIDNAYNSNVKSFKNSLQILEKIQKYTILVTPGLIDLKNDAEENEKLMEDIPGKCDEVIIVGYLNRDALVKGLKKQKFSNYKCLDTMEEALVYLEKKAFYDFVALIENDIDKTWMNMKN